MLELKNIRKEYKVGDTTTQVLKGVNVAFREKEFVAILGTSGAGKTTCLNIIGGLDRYTDGDLVIKGKSTKKFTSEEWDAYRNNSVGFVFQSYNLIMHLGIVENVELGMTLSGVSKAEKRKRALEVLEQVGLKEHIHKKPNQLSGGQMQRVAIARALANDPEILLCDEPTGALDTKTSVQIMDLIKEVAKDRLVIMVTHNPELAKEYADRIIEFKDGQIIGDTHPHQERPKEDQFKLKKTRMKFATALGLSLNNLRTKKGRTFLTAFASSIGIIGIAVILSLSSGFQKQIDKFQGDAMAELPVLITPSVAVVDEETMKAMHEEMKNKITGTAEFAKTDKVYLQNPEDLNIVHDNIITDEYMEYLNGIDSSLCTNIGYTRVVGLNLVRKIDDKYVPASFYSAMSQGTSASSMMSTSSSVGLSSYPIELTEDGDTYLETYYDVLAGKYPEKDTDLVLVVDEKNRVDVNALKSLGFETDNVKTIDFDEIVGTKMKLITNNDFYVKVETGNFVPSNQYEKMYESKDSIEVEIVGIVRKNKDTKTGLLAAGVAYSDNLAQHVIDKNKDSEIVKAQLDSDVNVMTMEKLDKAGKESFLAYLGESGTPYMIMVYPKDFDKKDQLLEYLDDYNEGKEEKDQIIYNDMAGSISGMTGGIMDAITIVLVAFAAISLVVSLIMICIITYTSVLERTKEIGVLKALGARKKDITRVFDAETCILGVFSGTLGVIIAWLCSFPINQVLLNLTDLKNVAQLQPLHAIILVVISTLLTMMGGHIPARMASKKDAVEALRSE